MTERGRRKTRIGVVISDVRDKTVTVEVVDSKRHPKYGKFVSLQTACSAGLLCYAASYEGHKFSKLENQIDSFTKIAAFLDRHIGNGHSK